LIQVYDIKAKRIMSGIRTRFPPPPTVIVLVGYKVVSATVVYTWPIEGGFESVVNEGQEVATLYNRDVWRYESELERAFSNDELVVDKRSRKYRWSNANTYDR